MRVSIWIGDATDPMRYVRGYQPGDDITPVYDFEWSPGSHYPQRHSDPDELGEEDDWVEWRQRLGATPTDIAEQAFRMFNGFPVTRWEHQHSERYYAGGNRSLSVGDVVVVGEIALGCEGAGWRMVDLPSQLDTPETQSQVDLGLVGPEPTSDASDSDLADFW